MSSARMMWSTKETSITPQAERMRMNFEDKPDVVYRGIVAMVTGNVNYLFDK